ncbi:energy-coupling factor transporter transmembrane component T family protein [Halosimplex aquaticum]|uniref:Energy-coupling factor transporter transmembrane component T family protein n=1 Tax=Halosimplex aquaticum TaxID=3026162 RepID=A0ABD5Y315_9EURY|nr:energy-coupling factor transporter transmembrane component T [Halosimplex aquaticum]
MLTYEPGDSLAHGLDPRAKLAVQFGIAIAVFSHPTARGFAVGGAVALAALAAGRLSPVRVLRAYRVVFLFLAVGPVLGGLALGDPWFRVGPALESARAVARVVPVVFVSAVYVRTTPVRETRAAIQRLLPGRIGRLFGVGVGLVFRFFPVVLGDLRTVRAAVRARAGERRPLRDRVSRVLARGLQRSQLRADRLTLALRARCFAWNPTLPALRFRTRDYLVAALGLALACAPLFTLVPGRFIPIG